MLNAIQLSNQEGKLVIDKSVLVANSYINEVLKELKKKNTIFALPLKKQKDAYKLYKNSRAK